MHVIGDYEQEGMLLYIIPVYGTHHYSVISLTSYYSIIFLLILYDQSEPKNHNTHSEQWSSSLQSRGWPLHCHFGSQWLPAVKVIMGEWF